MKRRRDREKRRVERTKVGNDVEESEIQNTREREDTRGAQHASKEAKELDARGNQGKYGGTFCAAEEKRENM